MKKTYVYKYTYITPEDEAKPLRYCPRCRADFACGSSIRLHLSINGQHHTEFTHLSQGELLDPSGHVLRGHHVGTFCSDCSLFLSNNEVVFEKRLVRDSEEEDTLHVVITYDPKTMMAAWGPFPSAKAARAWRDRLLVIAVALPLNPPETKEAPQ